MDGGMFECKVKTHHAQREEQKNCSSRDNHRQYIGQRYFREHTIHIYLLSYGTETGVFRNIGLRDEELHIPHPVFI